MIEKAPILITGCPRSGASMIANIIELCGAFGGTVTSNNHYENLRVKMLEAEYFRLLGVDPRGQYPLPEPESITIPVTWRKQVENAVIKEGYQNGTWFYKSSLISLIWPIWNYAFPNAKVVIVRRRTGDVITSCLKTSYMDAFSTREEWAEWVHEYEERFTAMINNGVNCKIIWPERMVTGDYTQLNELLDWLGLPWKSTIISTIDPLLWASRNKKEEV